MNSKGLYKKYNITKTNGQSIDDKAEYFVLRLDNNGEVNHVNSCKKAILTYADSIKEFLPELSNDLINKYK